ncbi:MAG: MBL fold metallo-hydrolase [Vicinamibacterales bacterium]
MSSRRARRAFRTPAAWAVATLLTGVAVGAQTPPTGLRPETLPVHGQVSLVSIGGTNAVVQIGPQGVLVVDTLSAELAPSLLAAIGAAAGARPIRYVLNTQADPAFTGGNAAVAAAGRQIVAGNFAGQVGQTAVAGQVGSAFIVAHENVLNAMSAPTGTQPAAPFASWPTDTFFQLEKTMYFNGEGIQLVHVPHAHSDGDVLVFFRGSDVIAAGEIFSTTGYPRIDVARGGHVNGVIEGLNRIIDLAISEQFTEGGTRIVPGRGRITDEFDVVEYRDMVTIVRDRVQAMIARGQTLAQVQAARPTLDWDPRYGATSGAWTTAMFVEAVYRSLAPAPGVGGRP